MFGIAECLQCCWDLDFFLFTFFLSLWLEQLMSWLWRHGVHLKGPLLYRNKIPETLKHQDLYEYLPPQIVSSHTFIKKNKQLWLSVSLALHIKTGCYQSLLDKFRRQLSLSSWFSCGMDTTVWNGAVRGFEPERVRPIGRKSYSRQLMTTINVLIYHLAFEML